MKIPIVSHTEINTISRHIVPDSMTAEKAVLLGYASPLDSLFMSKNYAINVATFTVRPITRLRLSTAEDRFDALAWACAEFVIKPLFKPGVVSREKDTNG